MNPFHIAKISDELRLKPAQVTATSQLLEEGATVPFIARYRKEATGSLDEVAVAAIRDRLTQLQELEKRRESILKSLRERELLTDDLQGKILEAETMTGLEDIYLPFRPKRRTRATMAREKGLEPLADTLFKQDDGVNPEEETRGFVDPERGVATVEDALAGARDIIAEQVNEDQEAREKMRVLYREEGVFLSKVVPGKEVEGSKYRDYFDWSEPVTKAPSHRILAMRRGEQEGFLDMQVYPPEDRAIALLETLFVHGEGPAAVEVRAAVHDSYKRLLSHAMETEIRLETKKRAEEEAIAVFSDNLRELLLAPPLGERNVMAIDPGIRTGCKVVCLNRQGKYIETDTVYLFKSDEARVAAATKIMTLIEANQVEAIAVGNGTAGRETEAFIKGLELPGEIQVVPVNESGASVYSASEVAREEFPDLDLTVKGAISIGRRLMDPLAELVKIDPKSIGVGQYQHDVNQTALKQSLDDVVMSCVNAVGVEINTASEQLLTYVSGLGPQLARNIVAHRDDRGPLSSREELKKISRLGPKAFEQAAGFLRIRGGGHPLDASAVHPESYPIVEAMARDLDCTIEELLSSEGLRKRIDPSKYVTEKVGMPTLTDILQELEKPGRDPRRRFEPMAFAEGVEKLEDLKPGMKVPGVVTNVTAFGAFIDIGVHQDGLVHISQMADYFVKDPGKVVKVQQRVMVRVLEVDLERRRISLSMKAEGTPVKKRSGERNGSEKKGAPKARDRKPPKGKVPGPFNNPFAKALK